MTFGNFSKNERLGVANCNTPRAKNFSATVLDLDGSYMIYQEEIVHSNSWIAGPQTAEAAICGTADSERKNRFFLREVSLVDSCWGRRNYSSGLNNNYQKQLRKEEYWLTFYVQNEPGTGITQTVLPGSCIRPDFGRAWPIKTISIIYQTARRKRSARV